MTQTQQRTAGPIYRGLTLRVDEDLVEDVRHERYDAVVEKVKGLISRHGASHGWHDGGVDTTVGLYWSTQRHVAEHFTGYPRDENVFQVVVTAMYDPEAPPGTPVGRSDSDYYIKGGEHEQTLSPGTALTITGIDIGLPEYSSYAPDPRDPDFLITNRTGTRWIKATNVGLKTQAGARGDLPEGLIMHTVPVSETYFTVAAEVGGKVVGALGYSVTRGVATIGTLWVEVSYRRLGVARAMHDYVVSRGQKIQHGEYRSPNGDAFARAVGEPPPDRRQFTNRDAEADGEALVRNMQRRLNDAVHSQRWASKIASPPPSWRDRGDRPRAEALIVPDRGRGRRNSYEVYLYGEPYARRGSLAEAKAVVEEVYGPLTWTKIEGDRKAHYDPVWQLTSMFNDADYFLVVDRLPRLGATASLGGEIIKQPAVGAGKMVASAKSLEHWRPTKGMFAKGQDTLDPRLFDIQTEEMLPRVQMAIMETLDGYWGPKYGDWHQWAEVYLAGSGASYWWDSDADLDILIGVDLERLREARPANREVSDEDILAHLNKGLQTDLRPTTKEFLGQFEATWFVNAGAYDIKALIPYAAYDVGLNEWVVKPPVLPKDWGPDMIPDEIWRRVEQTIRSVQEVLSLPEPERTIAGTVMFNAVHEERRASYSAHGGGWLSYGNVAYQALQQHPDRLLRQIFLCKHPEDRTSADVFEKIAAGGIEIQEADSRFGGQKRLRATQDGQYVGLLTWEVDTGEIVQVYVREGFRRQGIATEMLRRAREIDPKVHHAKDEAMSPDGKAWSQRVAERYPDDWWDERWPSTVMPGLMLGRMHPAAGPIQRVDNRGPNILGEIDGQYAGHIYWDKDTGEVTDIFVVPTYRRRGIGTALWQEAKKVDPKVKHSEEQTSDGKAWSRTVGKVADKRTIDMTEPLPDGWKGNGIYEMDISRFSSTGCVALLMNVSGMVWPIGWLTWDRERHTVEGVWVMEDYRGKGIAIDMLKEAEKVAGHSLREDSGEYTPEGFEWAKKRGINPKMESRVSTSDMARMQARMNNLLIGGDLLKRQVKKVGSRTARMAPQRFAGFEGPLARRFESYDDQSQRDIKAAVRALEEGTLAEPPDPKSGALRGFYTIPVGAKSESHTPERLIVMPTRDGWRAVYYLPGHNYEQAERDIAGWQRSMSKSAASTVTVYRGIHVKLTEEDFADLPRSLVNRVQKGGEDGTYRVHHPNIGVHWTTDREVARHFATPMAMRGDPPALYSNGWDVFVPVIITGKASSDDVVTDEEELRDAMVEGHGWEGLPSTTRLPEKEVLVRPGAQIEISDIEAVSPAQWWRVRQAWESLDAEKVRGFKVDWKRIGGGLRATASYSGEYGRGGTIYRGLRANLPPDVDAKVRALVYDPEMDVDSYEKWGPHGGKRVQAGELIVKALEKSHWDPQYGLGKHWTERWEMAQIGAMQGGAGDWGIILTATYDPSDVDPESDPTRPFMQSESEITLRPGAPITITKVEVPKLGGGYERVSYKPIQSKASKTASLPDGYRVEVRREFADKFGQPTLHVVAYFEDQPVAALAVYQAPDNRPRHDQMLIYVDQIEVYPEHRRKGVATAMWEVVHKTWPGVPVMHSWGPAQSPDAHQLNRSLKERFGPEMHLGFHQHTANPVYYAREWRWQAWAERNGYDSLLIQRPLPQLRKMVEGVLRDHGITTPLDISIGPKGLGYSEGQIKDGRAYILINADEKNFWNALHEASHIVCEHKGMDHWDNDHGPGFVEVFSEVLEVFGGIDSVDVGENPPERAVARR